LKFKLRPPKKGGVILTALPAFIALTAIVLIVYAVKGIIPFGSESVIYMDMWQMNVPIYYHIYDVLHFDKSLFYDFYTALGMNMSESVAICSLLSPFNLFFYFVPRDKIVEFMPIFTLLKLNFSAIFMSVFLRYRFKNTHNFWRTIASVAYGLCGMCMIFCTNSQWLDMAALFPLLMMCLDYSLRNKKVLPYAFMLAVYFIVNPYIAAITLLFIFFAASAQILLLAPKREKALRILHLGIGTFAGVGMSAFVVLPFIKQMGKTSRTASSSTLWDTIKAILDGTNPYGGGTEIQKYWMMWGTALAAAIIIYGIIINRKKIRRNIFSLICIALVVLQIFFENIHLIWHGGSYALFPMRFGFITTFVMWTIAISYINDIRKLNIFQPLPALFSNKLKAAIKVACALIGIAAIPFVSYLIAQSFIKVKSEYSEYIIWFSLALFGLLMILYFVLVNRKLRNVFRILVCTLLAAELSAGVYLFIGEPYIDPVFLQGPDMHSAEKVIDAGEAFETNDSVMSRVKNSDGTFMTNYPFIMEKAALSNWTHSVDAELQHSYKSLGYSTVYTRLLDAGGTVFLDALMNVEDVFTAETLPAKSYTFENSHTIKATDKNSADKTLNHYKTNYHFGEATVMSDAILNMPKGTDSFGFQNTAFYAMGGQGNLLHIIQYDAEIDPSVIIEKTAENQSVKYKINVTGCQNLYLAGLQSISININGVPHSMYDCGNVTYTYPQAYNNGIIDLGVYQDEVVDLEIVYPSGINEAYTRLVLMDYTLLDSLVAADNASDVRLIESDGNGLEFAAFGSENKNILFIPVSYDEGLSCEVNGEDAVVESVYGCFSAVKLEEGENTVEISFTPPGFKIGMIIAVISLVLILEYHFLKLRKRPPVFSYAVRTVAVWEYAKLWVIALIIVYIIPMVYQIVNTIKK